MLHDHGQSYVPQEPLTAGYGHGYGYDRPTADGMDKGYRFWGSPAVDRDRISTQDCVLPVLRDMYKAAWRAPEAFRLEYAAATEYALSLIRLAVQLEPVLAVGNSIGGGQHDSEENALHFAAGCGCLEVAQLLLQWNPALNFKKDSRGQTPLAWAARHGMAAMTELLLKYGADPSKVDIEGRRPLHLAAARGHPTICGLLVRSSAESVESATDAGHTPLHLAAACGSESCCRILLEAGADISKRSRLDRRTALHLAGLAGHASVAKLLASVATLEVLLAEDSFGATASQLADRANHLEVARLLREPEEAHRSRVEKWAALLAEARNDAQVPAKCFQERASVELAPPILERVGRQTLELSCVVQDLEYRLLEYILEVRDCNGGPQSAAPARVYFTRLGEQKKVDKVSFEVPNKRLSGSPVWELGGCYDFRLTARCSRCAWQPLAPWQVISPWSKPYVLSIQQGKRRKSASKGIRRRFE